MTEPKTNRRDEPETEPTSERPPYLPGDPVPRRDVARMIRVDQAGEYGATRIYEGQLAVIRRGRAAGAIREMAEQEQRHLAQFDRLTTARRVRPTALSPLWHVAGYALGAATALLGERAAMACTVAVEEVIDGHYACQAEALADGDPEFAETIRAARADELAHRDTALAHDATEAPGYELLSAAIKTGARLAIWLSERI
jgi:3-demethoxyubiquinol 3-hydroxylase